MAGIFFLQTFELKCQNPKSKDPSEETASTNRRFFISISFENIVDIKKMAQKGLMWTFELIMQQHKFHKIHLV